MIECLASGVVYENPKPHLRSQQAFHPTLADLGDGELVCAFDLGQAVEALDYRTYRSRSLDGGASWTFEGALFEPPPGRPTTSTIRINRTSAGLVGFGSLAYRDDPEEGVLNRDNLGYAPMDLVLLRSADKGKSWAGPEKIETPLAGPAFETCHNIVELPDGRWLAPTATWRGWDGDLPNGEKAIVLISEDQGRSWPQYGVAFDGSAEGLIHWEQSVVSLGGSDVVSIAWVYHPESGETRPNRFAVSHDGGATFGAAAEIGINGQTCKGLRLHDGRLLLAYRRNDQPGLWACLANFDGTRWELLAQQPLWGGRTSSGMAGEANRSDELSGLKFGFPQFVQFDNGRVLLVFWGFEDWGSKIFWLRLGIEGA